MYTILGTRGFFAAAAAAALTLTSIPANASSLPLLSWDASFICAGPSSCPTTLPFTGGTLSTSYTDNSGVSNVTGTGFVSPNPSISSTTTTTDTHVSDPNPTAQASINLSYYMLISGPGAPTEHDAVLVDYHGNISASNFSAGASVQITLNSIPVFSANSNNGSTTIYNNGVISTVGNGTVDLTGTQLSLFSNYAYFIQLNANSFADALNSSTSASVDPWMSFDSLFDSTGFSFQFSDTIGNSPSTSGTPLPAALPLFATGLGGLSLFGLRRRKKAAAQAA